MEKAFGKLNVLVNNAGALSVSTIETISEEDWDSLITTNLKGPFLCLVPPCQRCAGLGEVRS